MAGGSYNNILRLGHAIRERAEDRRHEWAERGKEYVQEEAPVQTGYLRDHVTVHREGDKTDVIVSEADYSAAVNDGHHTAGGDFVAPNPFFDRGIARLRREMDNDRRPLL